MKTLFKLLLWLVVVVVVVVGAAAVLVPMLVDPNDYKGEIATQVKAQTGRDLVIDGNLKMTVFPWLGVDIGPTTLGNAKGFSAPLFAKSERLQVRVKLMPLISERRIEMDTVTVHGLELNIERLANGATNLDDLTKAGGGKPAAGGAEGEPPAIAGLALGGLSIKSAKVTMKDPSQTTTLSNFDLTSGALDFGKPVPVEGGLDVAMTNPQTTGRIDFKTTVTVQGNLVKADGFNLTALLDSAMGKVEAEIGGNLDLDSGQQTAKVGGLTLTANVASSVLPVSKFDAKLSADVALDGQKQAANVGGLSLTANLVGDALPGGKLDVKLAFSADVDSSTQMAKVTGLSLSASDLQVDGGVTVSEFLSAPNIAGKLSIAEFNLRKLLETLGQPVPVTADDKVLTAVAVKANLAGTSSSVSLAPLDVKLDDSNLKGTLSVAASGALRFDLAMDQIDADRYLPPKSEGKTASPGAAAAGASSDIPLEPVRALDVDGKIKLGKLKITGLSMSDISAAVKAKGGNVKLAPLKAKLYGGSYAGNIGFDARGKAAKLTLNEALTGVQISPLLKDLQGEDRLEGTADAQLKATTSGKNPDAMKAALNGSGMFKFSEGALKGVNIAAMIRDAKAKIMGGGGADANAPKRTDFSVMGGTFKIKNGVVDNRDFAAKSPLLRITGKGTADLAKEILNYRVTTSVVATAKGQGGKDLTDLAGIDIPIKVTGTFAKPEYGLDEGALVKALASGKAKALLGKGTKDIKAAVESKVQGAIGGKLKDAVGGGALGSLTKQLGGAASLPTTPAAPATGSSGAAAPADATKDPAAAASSALKSIFK